MKIYFDSFFFFETGFQYIALADLELTIYISDLLTLPSVLTEKWTHINAPLMLCDINIGYKYFLWKRKIAWEMNQSFMNIWCFQNQPYFQCWRPFNFRCINIFFETVLLCNFSWLRTFYLNHAGLKNTCFWLPSGEIKGMCRPGQPKLAIF